MECIACNSRHPPTTLYNSSRVKLVTVYSETHTVVWAEGFASAMAEALEGGNYRTYGYSCAGAIGYGSKGSWTSAFGQVNLACLHSVAGCNAALPCALHHNECHPTPCYCTCLLHQESLRECTCVNLVTQYKGNGTMTCACALYDNEA